MFKAGEGLEANGPVSSMQDLFKVLQLQVQLAKSEDDFMLDADGCDANKSCDSEVARLSLFKSNYSSMPQTVMRNPERSVVWNDGDSEGPKSFMEYSRCSAKKLIPS